MSSVEGDDEVATKTTQQIVVSLDEEQKSEIVQEIGDSILVELKENERLAKDIGRAVIDQMPVLSESTFIKIGTTMAVDAWLEDNSEEIVEEVGRLVVDELVESHAEMTVEESIGAVVEEVGRNTGD